MARLSHRKFPILFIREFILVNYPTNVFTAVEDFDTTLLGKHTIVNFNNTYIYTTSTSPTVREIERLVTLYNMSALSMIFTVMNQIIIKIFPTVAGLEPAIPSSGNWCLLH